MRRIFFILSLVLIVGCNNQNQPPENLEEAKPEGSLASSAPAQALTVTREEQGKNVQLSPLEIAQKEYLVAYDDYVRLLKESGPQTLETLQALANYQKKYQLYQMLLNAEETEPKASN